MRKVFACSLLSSCIFLALCFISPINAGGEEPEEPTTIELPKPKTDGKVSIENALSVRRSVRKYQDVPATLEEVSQILWSAQGVTGTTGGIQLRTCPSAGATYPLEVYLVAGNVKGLEAGIYKYLPSSNKLQEILTGDKRAELSKACYGQVWVKKAPFSIVFCAVYERTKKYGDKAPMFVHMEMGHASQNVYLQAVSLNMGTVAIGALTPDEVKKVLKINNNEVPLYAMPLGKLKSKK